MTMKIKEITDAIERFAPLALQEEYDNAGLVVGDPEREVGRALLAVDVTEEVLDEAERLSTMLGLTMAERDACFFDAENRFSRSATLELPKRGKRQ